MYAVKPQNVDKVHGEIYKAVQRGDVREDATILSVAAGKPIESFLGSGIERIARSMPNTPAQSEYYFDTCSSMDGDHLDEKY